MVGKIMRFSFERKFNDRKLRLVLIAIVLSPRIKDPSQMRSKYSSVPTIASRKASKVFKKSQNCRKNRKFEKISEFFYHFLGKSSKEYKNILKQFLPLISTGGA